MPSASSHMSLSALLRIPLATASSRNRFRSEGSRQPSSPKQAESGQRTSHIGVVGGMQSKRTFDKQRKFPYTSKVTNDAGLSFFDRSRNHHFILARSKLIVFIQKVIIPVLAWKRCSASQRIDNGRALAANVNARCSPSGSGGGEVAFLGVHSLWPVAVARRRGVNGDAIIPIQNTIRFSHAGAVRGPTFPCRTEASVASVAMQA